MKNQLKFLFLILILTFLFAFDGNETTNIINVKILYRQENDEKLNNFSKLKVNTKFLNTADDRIRAIIGYYSSKAGTDCKWDNNEANSDLSNLNCKLTKALNLGFQCSKKQKLFLKKWFSEEKDVLTDIETCYNVPETATSQSIYDYISLEIIGNAITVKYKKVDSNLRTESFLETEGIDKYRIEANKIKVISKVTMQK